MKRMPRVVAAGLACLAIAVLSLPFGRDRGWSPAPPPPVTQTQLAAAAEQICPTRLPECSGFHFDPPPPASFVARPGDHTPTVLLRRLLITAPAVLVGWLVYACVLSARRKRCGQQGGDPPFSSAPPIAELSAPASGRRLTIR